MGEFRIRPATVDDAALILDFIVELATYERAAEQVTATVDDIRESLFSPKAGARAVICSHAGRPVGYAVYFHNYSTWLGRHGMYIEDIYISPPWRTNGAGTRLLQYLAELAIDEGCGRLEWSVLDWNAPAISFYEKIGARPQAEWITYRLAGEALRSFAAAGPDSAGEPAGRGASDGRETTGNSDD